MIIGGDNEQFAKSLAGEGVDGDIGESTVRAGVDSSSGWQMRKQMNVEA
jgi:hypothetical protein